MVFFVKRYSEANKHVERPRRIVKKPVRVEVAVPRKRRTKATSTPVAGKMRRKVEKAKKASWRLRRVTSEGDEVQRIQPEVERVDWNLMAEEEEEPIQGEGEQEEEGGAAGGDGGTDR